MARGSRTKSKGTCTLCKYTLDKSAMTKHLQSCMEKSQTEKKSEKGQSPSFFFHVLVEGHGLPEYWMHPKVLSSASLKVLDHFLRKTWLECCGHMSSFNIGRNEISMSRKLQDVLRPGMKFIHQYDFGSTTELLLTVISELEVDIGKKKVEILARNDPREVKCSHCDKVASHICVECDYDACWLCDDCAEDHKCGEDMLLPVVNSPRTGVCGYTG